MAYDENPGMELAFVDLLFRVSQFYHEIPQQILIGYAMQIVQDLRMFNLRMRAANNNMASPYSLLENGDNIYGQVKIEGSHLSSRPRSMYQLIAARARLLYGRYHLLRALRYVRAEEVLLVRSQGMYLAQVRNERMETMARRGAELVNIGRNFFVHLGSLPPANRPYIDVAPNLEDTIGLVALMLAETARIDREVADHNNEVYWRRRIEEIRADALSRF
ncbi:hypothetical protein UCRPC4_g01537 [Phaeomoniella chlamydospora]|uniref:Uncharacterized protein n=1 Tax=Phaeomoniella chlamydospora TaxID=158046 RepID=A0A0G2EU92_PHACM|nr:hypothetical protein UCRPC4_g01537 [Phaeomoniella chlamydospora]